MIPNKYLGVDNLPTFDWKDLHLINGQFCYGEDNTFDRPCETLVFISEDGTQYIIGTRIKDGQV